MRILITGGSGFLGINLIRFLLIKKITNITSIDLVEFDYPEKDKITTIKGDIRDAQLLIKALRNTDIVIHAAAALPLHTQEEIFSTEVTGTKNVLNAAYINKVERLIHISSAAVYGISGQSPLYENSPLSGVGAYGKAKILAEKLCLKYRKKGMIIPILRPTSFIGPERLGAFALLYNWANDGKNFPMIGSGDNYYQFLDVHDLCEAIYLCMIKKTSSANNTFNIGAKIFKTMKEDYQAVLDYAGFNKKIFSLPATPLILILRILEFLHLSPLYNWIYETASKDFFVSIKKAETLIGFEPKYSNQEALIRNFKWYLENNKDFNELTGKSHRVPWNQGVLSFFKRFF